MRSNAALYDLAFTLEPAGAFPHSLENEGIYVGQLQTKIPHTYWMRTSLGMLLFLFRAKVVRTTRVPRPARAEDTLMLAGRKSLGWIVSKDRDCDRPGQKQARYHAAPVEHTYPSYIES